MDPFQFITATGGIYGYALVLGLLLICGLGVPIPKDIILVSGGYVASESGHAVLPMILIGLVGIMAGDSLIFWLGRRIGTARVSRSFLGRVITPERLARAEELFHRHHEKIFIAARFMPGVRAVTYFSAGAIGVPFWKFFLFDGLAALVSAPLWVILGYRYGHTIVEEAHKWQNAILGGIAVLLLGVWLWRRRVKAASVAESDRPAAP